MSPRLQPQTASVVEPTRILIFGQSNSGGVQLADRSLAWPNLVANALPAMTGRPVTITFRPFFAHAPGSDAYVAREIRKYEPDIVFLMLSTFSFVNRVVEPGVRERFGDRFGNGYRWLATRLDKQTRHRGKLLAGVNRSARTVARRAFRARPVTTYEVALEGTTAALQRLAREERLQVVAMHGVVQLDKRRNGRPSDKEVVVRKFFEEMRAVTARLHVTFINMQDGTVPDSWFLPDGLHVSADAHEAIAAAVLGAFREGRLRVESE